MFNIYKQDITNSDDVLFEKISSNINVNESFCINEILNNLNIDATQFKNAKNYATNLISKIRDIRISGIGTDAIMNEFKLSTPEGIALMCLAESLLRIPDKFTQNQIIKEKILTGNWQQTINNTNIFISITRWSLTLCGKILTIDEQSLFKTLKQIIAATGEPIIRKAMQFAVKFMGKQFVIGETIHEALQKSSQIKNNGYKYSYDMLGEAAMTENDALKYFQSYMDAIHAVGTNNTIKNIIDGSGISVKLSALYPRYQRSKYEDVITILYSRLKELFITAKQYQIAIFIDAEEVDRLELSLIILKKLILDPDLKNFNGIGFVIQAYQKRAHNVVDYIVNLAQVNNCKLLVRLVKGAYWDSEIKKAQMEGYLDYPVFTRKLYTDLSYLYCAQKLLANQNHIYPLFATHNAFTVALIKELGINKEYEFQCLYGMGETLYNNIIGVGNLNKICRIYAPVGNHKTLLAYLVRRLLENGANSSFVHQIIDKNIPIESLLINPVEFAIKNNALPNKNLLNPLHIYTNNRINSKGIDLTNNNSLKNLQLELNKFNRKLYHAKSLIANFENQNTTNLQHVTNPANIEDVIGDFQASRISDVAIAITNAKIGFKKWSAIDYQERSNIINSFADLMEENIYELINLLVREAGKTIQNAINEVREAVDFCRYYANLTLNDLSKISYNPLGIIVCISPWNFPLAIFIGEICSALIVGNSVIAKPANQTNLIAYYAVELMYKAGVPSDALQLLLGSGSVIGNALTLNQDISGVIFTGSTQTAKQINSNLAKHPSNSIIIAETGGQNTMIVDSSALPEQVVQDVINSAFDSAGQRCSALRVLYLQDEIADTLIEMLKGAMQKLYIGNPINLYTDVGPVIDKSSQKILLEHIETMQSKSQLIYQCVLSNECKNGIFIAPTLIEIKNINELKTEVFGPILHIIRFASNKIEQVINDINNTGYGLTQGIHSRIKTFYNNIVNKVHAGNFYINRNIIGAVVGVQPFGGEGLSGTGPKAGGALYLFRLIQTLQQPKLTNLSNINNHHELQQFLNLLPKIINDKEIIHTLLQYANNMLQYSLNQKNINLQGITGEENYVFFAPRGMIFCCANNLIEYIQQIICCIITNNKIAILNDKNTQKLNVLKYKNIFFYNNFDEIKIINAVLVSNNYNNIQILKINMANRSGILTILIQQMQNNEYPLYLLQTEKSVSNNYTASGGNIALMNLQDSI